MELPSSIAPGASATFTFNVTAPSTVGSYNFQWRMVEDNVEWFGAFTTNVAVTVQGQAAAQIYYIHPDHLGTPREITRSSDNKIVWRWDNTEPFGSSQPNEDPSALGAFNFNLRFPGQYYDVDSGLSYNYFRDYDSSIGRYVESDPIGLKGENVNTYSYVFGNSIAYIDSNGLRVVFLGSGSNASALRGAYSVVKATRRGEELCKILEDSPRTFTIRGDRPEAFFDPNTNTVNVNTSFHPMTQTSAGQQPATTDVIMGHELGHAATGTRDDGPGRMNNVNQNENPIRQELQYPPRTRY